MKFDIKRDLKNKVFKVDIARKIIFDDPETEKETQLEDDFGPIEIEVGGLFEGWVKEDTLEVSITKPEEKDAKCQSLRFALNKNKIKLIKDVEISFKCDATLESNLSEKLNSLKIAELKCELFIKIIETRIKEAVELWKKQNTNFENNAPKEINAPLS